MTDPAPDQEPSGPGERRPVAMTPYAIAVALFAAFVVGGILGKAVPLWLVAVLGLAVGVAVFVFVDATRAYPGAGSALAAALIRWSLRPGVISGIPLMSKTTAPLAASAERDAR